MADRSEAAGVGSAMASLALSLSIQNAGTSLRVVILEPWGWEFTLDEGDKLEVSAQAGPGEASLRLVEADRRTLIFAAGCSEPCVTQEGPNWRGLAQTARLRRPIVRLWGFGRHSTRCGTEISIIKCQS